MLIFYRVLVHISQDCPSITYTRFMPYRVCEFMPSDAEGGTVNHRSSEVSLIYCTVINFAEDGIYSQPIKEYESICYRRTTWFYCLNDV